MESLRDKRRRPTHPGEILREDVLPDLRISRSEFAKRLGVSRQTVYELINERRPLTPDVAIRLSRLIGGTASTWLRLQQAVDLWEVEHAPTKKYAGIKRLRSSDERKVS